MGMKRHHIYVEKRYLILIHCRKSISPTGSWGRSVQCSRKAKIFEEVEGHPEPLGFCRQHSTAATEKRREVRAVIYDAETTARRKAWAQRALGGRCFLAVKAMTDKEAAVSPDIPYDLWQLVQESCN